MSKARYKRKITLTVDSELWAECRQKRKEYGLNWSQIAEQSFLAVLLQLREVEKIVKSASTGSSGLDASIVKSQLNDYISRTCSQVNEDFKEMSQELEVQIPD